MNSYHSERKSTSNFFFILRLNLSLWPLSLQIIYFNGPNMFVYRNCKFLRAYIRKNISYETQIAHDALLPKIFVTAKGLKFDVKAQYKINAMTAVRRCRMAAKSFKYSQKEKNVGSTFSVFFQKNIELLASLLAQERKIIRELFVRTTLWIQDQLAYHSHRYVHMPLRAWCT